MLRIVVDLYTSETKSVKTYVELFPGGKELNVLDSLYLFNLLSETCNTFRVYHNAHVIHRSIVVSVGIRINTYDNNMTNFLNIFTAISEANHLYQNIERNINIIQELVPRCKLLGKELKQYHKFMVR